MAYARAASKKSSASLSSKSETEERNDRRSSASTTREPGPLRGGGPVVGFGASTLDTREMPDISPKLTVNEQGDKYEREAERVADAVMRMPDPESTVETQEKVPSDRIQRMCARCQRRYRQGKPLNCETCEPELQHYEEASMGGKATHSDGFEQAAEVSREPGKPLSEGPQSFFENRMGEDFGDVRIHTGRDADRAAQSIDARAFTLGDDIVFRSGEYQPNTQDGKRLLAHELTHVVQQRTGTSGNSGSMGDVETEKSLQRQVLPYPIGEGTEKGTESSGQSVRSQKLETEPSTGTPTGTSQQQGSSQQEGSSEKGSFLSSFGSASEKAMECAERTGMSVSRLSTLDFDSLTSLLGLPEPKGSPPQKLDAAITALLHPCLQMFPGYSQLVAVEKLQEIQAFIRGAWKVIQNPRALLEPLKKALGERIKKVPEEARQKVRENAEGKLSESHIEGILRHMEPKIQYLLENWWEVLKKSAWEQIWPWEGAMTDLTTIFKHIGEGATHLWNLNLGKAGSELLESWRSTNALLGRFYGWFFIASTLIGTVVGAFFGGAGAVPGFIAGASFATEVGMGLLVSAIAAETVNIGKGVVGIHTAENRKDREAAYEDVAESGLGLGIMAGLALLGAAAARFARAMIARFPRLKVEIRKFTQPLKRESAWIRYKDKGGKLSREQWETAYNRLMKNKETGEFFEKVLQGEEGGERQVTRTVSESRNYRDADVQEVDHVGPARAERLRQADIDNVEKLRSSTVDEINDALNIKSGTKLASKIKRKADDIDLSVSHERRVDIERGQSIFEVKTGRPDLTDFTSRQIRVDKMLQDVADYNPKWVFYRGRPTPKLRSRLEEEGIDIQVRDLPVGGYGFGAAGAKPEEEIGKPPSK